MLSKQYISNFKKIVRRKKYAIDVNKFEQLLNKLLLVFDYIKLLCKKIQDILFSLLKNKALFIEILLNLFEKLYNFIVKAFDSAIVDIAIRDNLEQIELVYYI